MRIRTTIYLLMAALAGCDTDDFVIVGESDSCSSSSSAGEQTDECIGDECERSVTDPPLAEIPAQTHPSQPARAPAQERR